MKFIRDIIGEKRQMNGQHSEVASATGSRNMFADDFAPDAGMPDAGMTDAGMPDAGMPDAEMTPVRASEREAEPAGDPFAPEPEDVLRDLEEELEAAAAERELARQEEAMAEAAVADDVQEDLPEDEGDDFADILAGFSDHEEIDARESEQDGASLRSPEENVAAMRGLAASIKQTQPPVAEEAAPAAAPQEDAAAFVAPSPRPAPRQAAEQARERIMRAPQPRVEAAEPLREAPLEAAAPVAPADPAESFAQPVEVPTLAAGRGANRQGRVKTRLLGFNAGPESEADPIASNAEASVASYTKFPLGWLIVTEGPGRGAAFTIFSGVSKIGRGKDQTVALDFGDNSISRDNHAAIAFDAAQKSFFIGHGGKANLVRRNDRPVLSTEELSAGDKITIGETVLRFVPLCGPDFVWEDTSESDWSHAVNS